MWIQNLDPNFTRLWNLHEVLFVNGQAWYLTYHCPVDNLFRCQWVHVDILSSFFLAQGHLNFDWGPRSVYCQVWCRVINMDMFSFSYTYSSSLTSTIYFGIFFLQSVFLASLSRIRYPQVWTNCVCLQSDGVIIVNKTGFNYTKMRGLITKSLLQRGLIQKVLV